MTFTYDLSAGFTDPTRVRQALGDTDSAAPKFSDEEIAATIVEQGTWQKATLALIDSLLAKLSLPDFQADWLRVDHSKARDGYMELRKRLASQYGLRRYVTGTAVPTYRADSGQTEAPDYSGGRP